MRGYNMKIFRTDQKLLADFRETIHSENTHASHTNATEQYGYVEGVFHASVGRYTLSFHDARRLCALLGESLATYDQLYTAWEAGLQKCRSADDNGYYVCEMSNSERYMDPERMQDRISFDYYGTTTEMLYSLLPTCDSITCNHGGKCTQGQRYECDDAAGGREGSFSSSSGHIYSLTFNDAQRLCALLGATLATYDQLYTAWEAGLQRCRYGWLADATLRYPMQTSKPGCRDRIGIIESPTPQDKSTTSNAWCYK
ncbi:aggrecan core protein-like [Pocillopora verrucosa]|uniref:aggrecan core protein-like n=1 Tax=Pocillopora verrucosa TaxID=203993 RepID=UPI00334123E8